MEEVRASTVENLFKDISGRRTAIIKALTIDVKKFVRKCDQYLKKDDDDEEVFLYGFLNGKWRVSTAAKTEADRRPGPILGINFTRDDRMKFEEWLGVLAAFSDAWLLSLAFYIGASNHFFNRSERQRLFGMINDLPTIAETINARYKFRKPPKEEDDDNEKCGSCENKPKQNEREFWICCESCETWFHGKCVKISPHHSKRIQNFECPSCSCKKNKSERARPQSNYSTIRKVTFKVKSDKSR